MRINIFSSASKPSLWYHRFLPGPRTYSLVQASAFLWLWRPLGRRYGGWHVGVSFAETFHKVMIRFRQCHAFVMRYAMDPMFRVLITLNGHVAQEIIVDSSPSNLVHAILIGIVPISEVVSTSTVVELEAKWMVR